MNQTFDVPCLNFRQKLEDDAYDAECATDKIVEKSMAYITDLENRVSEQDGLILEQSDRITDLKGLLDGGLVELVGELAKVVDSYCCTSCPIIPGKGCAGCVTRKVIKNAKEAMS